MNFSSNLFIVVVSKPFCGNELLHFISTMFCPADSIKLIKMKHEYLCKTTQRQLKLCHSVKEEQNQKKKNKICKMDTFDPLENSIVSNKTKQFCSAFLRLKKKKSR